MEEPKPTEVQIKNLKVSDFFDKRFVEIIEKELKDTVFQHFCLYITIKKGDKNEWKPIDRLAISHNEIEDEKNKITNVGTENPESLEKLLKVIKEFRR